MHAALRAASQLERSPIMRDDAYRKTGPPAGAPPPVGRPVGAAPCVPNAAEPSKTPPWNGGFPEDGALVFNTRPPQFLPSLSHENPHVLPSPQDTLHPKKSPVFTSFVPHVVFTCSAVSLVSACPAPATKHDAAMAAIKIMDLCIAIVLLHLNDAADLDPERWFRNAQKAALQKDFSACR